MITWMWGGALAMQPPLAETYVLEMHQSSTARVPVLGKTRSTTTSRTLVRTVPGGPTPVLSRQTCSVQLDSPSPLVETRVPDAFVESLGIMSGPASLTPEGDGWRFELDLGQVHVGYDPVQAPGGVPRTADDAAVIDWDGDGRPGATIELRIAGVGTFGIEVAQRSHALLEGTLFPDGRIEGALSVKLLEQAVLGADHKLLRSSVQPSPDDTRSHFTMFPVAPATTCDDLGRRPKGR